MVLEKSHKTGGGTYNPEDKGLYFIASSPTYSKEAVEAGLVKSILIAVPEIKSKDIPLLASWSEMGIKIFVDSGVYSAIQKTKKEKKITQTQALNLPPEEIVGYSKLRKHYVETIRKIEPYIWGYVELDFGGKDNKRITRQGLEDEGLKPIPVYHPFNDGWDYFDELASKYDRICLGNIVYVEPPERIRILHTINERKKKYEPLWIHALGVTPNWLLYTLPLESVDSSSWLSGSRHGTLSGTGGGFNLGKLPREFIYKKDEKDSYKKLIHLMSYKASMYETEWESITKDMEKLSNNGND